MRKSAALVAAQFINTIFDLIMSHTPTVGRLKRPAGLKSIFWQRVWIEALAQGQAGQVMLARF